MREGIHPEKKWVTKDVNEPSMFTGDDFTNFVQWFDTGWTPYYGHHEGDGWKSHERAQLLWKKLGLKVRMYIQGQSGMNEIPEYMEMLKFLKRRYGPRQISLQMR